MKIIPLLIQLLSTMLMSVWLLVSGNTEPTVIRNKGCPQAAKATSPEVVAVGDKSHPRKASEVPHAARATGWQLTAQGRSLQAPPMHEGIRFPRPPIRRQLAWNGPMGPESCSKAQVAGRLLAARLRSPQTIVPENPKLTTGESLP